jgi:hypothetical protein
MSSHARFRDEEEDDYDEEGGNNLRLMLSNEAFDVTHGQLLSCTPWRLVLAVMGIALLGLTIITW